MQTWPVLLIGTSKGRTMLKSLSHDQPTITYSFHKSQITCIAICKGCIITSSEESILAIHHHDQSISYCDLLSPASRIVEVNCINDTVHNINDAF